MLSIYRNGHFVIKRSVHLSASVAGQIVGHNYRFKPNEFFKVGKFHKELPKGRKPTHIIVGAGAAGCVLVSYFRFKINFNCIFLNFRPID